MQLSFGTSLFKASGAIDLCRRKNGLHCIQQSKLHIGVARASSIEERESNVTTVQDSVSRSSTTGKEWMQDVVKELVDTSKFGTRGEGWFAAQLVITALVVFPPSPLQGVVDTCGWLMVLAGFGMMVAGQQSLGQNLTPLPKPRESNQLVTSGIYNYCRHPMYGGLVLAGFGLTLAMGNEVRMVMALLAFFIISEKASYEEKFLEELHHDYADYKKRTKKLIPYIF